MSLPKELVLRIEEEFRKRDPGISELAITDITEITGGWESPVYSFQSQIKKASGPAERGHVIRFYEGPQALAQARKDFQIMTRVNQFGVPTPALDFLIMDACEPAEAFLVMEKVEGETAAQSYPRGEDRDEQVRRLAEYQAVLHKMDWRDIWAPEDEDEAAEQDFVRARLDKVKREIGQLQSSDFDCNLAWLEKGIPAEGETFLSLLHNDYHPENALIRAEDGAMFIIDWTFADSGDFRMDLAWTLLQVSLMLGSEARESYLAAYEDAWGQKVEHLAFFEALKFTERMLTIAQWLQPDFDIPIRKISKAALRGSYKVHITNVYARLKEVTGCEIALIERL